MPVMGNVNGLAILPGSKLLDVDVLMREHSELREALRELAAMVRGECPSLLNDDSGGDGNLSLLIDDLLEA